jgi:uncharacterized PurR-regulated membrane protein YhhQ (DUF165 family)
MDTALLFRICNTAVIPCWALLIFAPGWVWTQRIVHSALVPALLGSVYVSIALFGPPAPEGAGFGSLEGVMLLFTVPEGVLAGWVHYLVFDLFVGAWEARDARRRGIHPALVGPCLILTLMLGPAGLLAYLALRAVRERTGTLVEIEAAGAA